MQIITSGWWHQHRQSPDASAICQDSNSSVKVMTAPGLMTEKMTVTLTTEWRLSQDGNVSQFMKSAMIRAFWGHRLAFHPRVEFEAAISADSVSLSSVVIWRNGSCHPSHVSDDADVDNHQSWSDATKETIETTEPITVIWCRRAAPLKIKCWCLWYLQCSEYLGRVMLMALRDDWSKVQETVQAVPTSWSKLHIYLEHECTSKQIQKTRIHMKNTKYSYTEDDKYGFCRLIKDSWKP